MSFGNVLLFSSSVVFGAAFLLKIDASRKLINKFREDNADNAALNSFLGSISSFHDRNRKGCMQFYFSNAALLVSGFVYDRSAITKIFGLCAFGASLYSILSLKDAFQSSKSLPKRASEFARAAANDFEGTTSRLAARVNNALNDSDSDDDNDRSSTTTTTTTTTTGFRRAASKVNRSFDDAVDTAEGVLDNVEDALQNSAFGRATDAIEEVLSNLSEGVGSLFRGGKSSSSKKGGARR